VQFFFILLLRLVSESPGRRALHGAGSKRVDQSGSVLGSAPGEPPTKKGTLLLMGLSGR